VGLSGRLPMVAMPPCERHPISADWRFRALAVLGSDVGDSLGLVKGENLLA
jgi:hypothetical protein